LRVPPSRRIRLFYLHREEKTGSTARRVAVCGSQDKADLTACRSDPSQETIFKYKLVLALSDTGRASVRRRQAKISDRKPPVFKRRVEHR
jgi:hypothetical protein